MTENEPIEVPAQAAEASPTPDEYAETPAETPLETGAPAPAARPPRQVLPLLLQGFTYLLLIVSVGAVALLARQRLFGTTVTDPTEPAVTQAASVAPVETLTGSGGAVTLDGVKLPPLETGVAASDFGVGGGGIPRYALLDTTIPPRARIDVITYTVQKGDTLFLIADSFGVKPETLLWGNFDVLEDNPHLLSPDQVLNILPIDGTYYQWAEGDTLSKVAEFFKVDAQVILDYPGNRFDLAFDTLDNPNIEVGRWIIVPGGTRAIKDWGPPAISRSNPASARYYGAGHCGSIYTGAVGNGWFVWPTTARTISGYTYSPGVHPAIDIAGATGNAVYATDSGVVVYAGWSNYGYGNLVVIDHGNGWQSAYAHLDTYSVGCGQSVFQGGGIGTVGNTGNSYGSHLHFELVYNGAKLNPLDFLQ